MGKIKFEIADDKFIRKPSASHELSILVGMDSFAYMVTDTNQAVLTVKDCSYDSTVLNSADLEKQIQLILDQDKFLKSSHPNIRLGFLNAKSALVPTRLYNENEQKTYLRQLTDIDENYRVLVDDLEQFSAKNVYAVYKSFHNFSMKNFPGVKTFHVNTALLMGFRYLATQKEGHNLYIHVRSGEVFVYLFEGNDLKFSNSFNYESSRDFIYYILMIFDQFDLNPKDIPVFLSGQLLQDSEVFRLLYRYVKNTSFVEPPAYFRYSSNWGNYPKYFYFDLFSLTFCK